MAQLVLTIELAGCPTVCMHCWAQGMRYGEMPLSDVARVLEGAHRFCAARELAFSAYPMHEVVAHSRAGDVLAVFAEHVGADEFEPLSTTGVPLACREDWREVLAAAAALGTTTVWVALHGLGAEHDRVVNRAGAFDETCLAVERVHAAGLRAGCNVFLTKVNAKQFDDLRKVLWDLRVDDVSFEPAHYYPTRRSRRYAVHQPALDDLAPLSGRVLEASRFHRCEWSDLTGYTEAAHVRSLLAGEWPDERRSEMPVELVCRRNLDLHTGVAGLYGTRHGNLASERAEDVLERALACGPAERELLYFRRAPIPRVRELALRHGHPAGEEVRFSRHSMHYRWLDRAIAA